MTENLSGSSNISRGYTLNSKVIETTSLIGVTGATDMILTNGPETTITSIPQGVAVAIVCPSGAEIFYGELKKDWETKK